MTVAQRLYLLIVSVLVALAGLAGIGIFQMNKVYAAANYANVNTVPSLIDLDTAVSALAAMRVQMYQMSAQPDGGKRRDMATSVRAQQAAFGHALDKYEKDDITNQKDRDLLDADRKALTAYTAVIDKVLALSEADRRDEARDTLLGNQSLAQALVGAVDAHRQYNVDIGKAGDAAAVAALNTANWLSALIGLAAVLGAAGMGILLARKIVTALNAAVKIAQTVATGDLTGRIEVTSNDETGQLMQALKDMNDSLVIIVAEVRVGTDTIATASSQIASGNQDLSSRTEQQASALEETASAMEQLTGTVQQNADNARQANQLAVTASGFATEGGAVVAQVVTTMGSINDSARKIVDIIGVIDGIAFQTNILALNAAVEAARAGEQGRGFAVVATEVRSLAQRSAAAAKEIKVLIDHSVNQVDAGSKLVGEAGATMQKIVDSVQRVTDVVSEISAASVEQTTGIEQINQAISSMDQSTQQNAALVEEAAAAASALQEHAAGLSQVVGVFKLTHGQHAAPAPGRALLAKPARAASSAAPSAKPARAAALPAVGRASSKPRPVPHAQAGAVSNWEEF